MNNNFLVTIVGPTAIGKTNLSIQLAEAFNTEIISADSRQFFKEMQIGTAAPTPKELETAPHHFIHHKSIQEKYSVGDFEREAIDKISRLFKNHSILIIVGGSGLYVKSVLEGLDSFPDVAPEIRKDLNLVVEKEGLQPLQEKLQHLDPETYKKIDIENPHRIIRALEICIATGRPFSQYLNKSKTFRNFIPIKIGLTGPREKIYENINKRVDIMMKNGLLQEVKELYPHRNLNALNTVGYKELFEFLDGKTFLKDAIEEVKKNTRRFAKRQLTWFRKEKDITWFNYTTPPGEIIDFVKKEIKKFKEQLP